MGCYIWYSEERTGRGVRLPSPLAVPNVTAHPSTASVPNTVLLFNVPIKGINLLKFGWRLQIAINTQLVAAREGSESNLWKGFDEWVGTLRRDTRGEHSIFLDLLSLQQYAY